MLIIDFLNGIHTYLLAWKFISDLESDRFLQCATIRHVFSFYMSLTVPKEFLHWKTNIQIPYALWASHLLRCNGHVCWFDFWEFECEMFIKTEIWNFAQCKQHDKRNALQVDETNLPNWHNGSVWFWYTTFQRETK